MSIIKKEIFTTIKLAGNKTATVYEISGYDLLRASLASGSDSALVPYNLLIEATLINGKKMESLSELENMNALDTMAILEIINLQLTKQ